MFERPSDMLDCAADVTQRETEARIQVALSDQRSKLPRKGACYNCDEEVEDLFCDEDCRDDYEWREERRKANRGPA